LLYLHCQEIGSCQHRNGSGNQVNTEIDVSKIKYENRENIKSILNELLKLSQLLNEWISNNTKLYQEITKNNVTRNKNQSSEEFLSHFHEILLKIYSIKSDILTKINKVDYQNKEELRLLSDIFETVTSFTEMFEREYSLKETIISDILNRVLKKEELETSYSLITNEPYIDYDCLTSYLNTKTILYQTLSSSA